MSHKYKVRQLVRITHQNFSDKRATASGIYEVTRLMPADQTGEVSYSIKSSGFGERAVRDHGTGVNRLTSAEAFFRGSQIYDPVALLRQGDETLYVARVGRKASRQFMILTPTGEPAWPHEPLGSLSDVAWALRAHRWHLVTPEPMGESTQPARTLERLLTERA